MFYWSVLLGLVVVSECGGHGYHGYRGSEHLEHDHFNHNRPHPPEQCEVQIRINQQFEGSYKEYHELKYKYEDVVELECITGFRSTQWIDSHGFSTGTLYGDVILRMTPDEYDDGQILTCFSMAGNTLIRSNGITLNSQDVTGTTNTGTALKPVYIKSGDTWTRPPDCQNGYLKLPSNNQIIVQSRNKTNLITDYGRSDNGTVLFCITYYKITQRQDDVERFKPIFTYGRLKTGYISYLATSTQATRVIVPSTLSTRKNLPDSQATTRHSESNSSESDEDGDHGVNTAAIVGGVLGTIILVLVGVLLACWCSTARRRQMQQATESTVIYTEIEELSRDAPPPPPRNQPPYAKILGTVAAQRPRPLPDVGTHKEAPYATLAAPVTPKENLYCTVK